MADRTIKRNGRGQIVSYEIVGVNDSTVSTLQYGKVLFKIAGQSGTYADKYNSTSFSNEINVVVSDELIDSDTIINPQITLGEIITTQDQRATTGGGGTIVGSIDTTPFGVPGDYINEYRIFTRNDGATIPYSWTGTFWQEL